MELTEFETNIVSGIDDCSGAVKHCGKNAVRHLAKAWKLAEIDKEMAMFRAITAEEEAAASLFYSLKNHRYENANRIAFRSHPHKLGLFPFLISISQFLEDTLGGERSPFGNYKLIHTRQSGRRAMEIALPVRSIEHHAFPRPPLHFYVSTCDTGEPHTFKEEFSRAVQGKNFRSALEYINAIAGQRNKILYASAGGIPEVGGNMEGYLLKQKQKVLIILSIVLLSDPWVKEFGKAGFIQQGLNAYLVLLEKIEAANVANNSV